MSPTDKLEALFEAERAIRRLHAELVAGDPSALLDALEAATRAALAEGCPASTPRLVRVAPLLGEVALSQSSARGTSSQGAASGAGVRSVDLLIDVLGCDEPEARH